MAENSSGSSNSGLSFVVGGLVVVVAIGAFLFYGGYVGGHSSKTTTDIIANVISNMLLR